MKDYTILAKFIIPPEQSDVVLRDPIFSGVQYAGCYLLEDNREDRNEWFRNDPDKPFNPRNNHACKYVLAYEDYGNVFLPKDATEVDEFDLDQVQGYKNYTLALLGFQAAINELLMEMNTTRVQSDTQDYLDRAYARGREYERSQAAKEEFEQRLSEDPPFLV